MEEAAAPTYAAVLGACIGAVGGGVAADALRLDMNWRDDEFRRTRSRSATCIFGHDGP